MQARTLEALAEYCKEAIKKAPAAKSDIVEIYYLCKEEYEDEGSLEEFDKAYQDIAEILNKQ